MIFIIRLNNSNKKSIVQIQITKNSLENNINNKYLTLNKIQMLQFKKKLTFCKKECNQRENKRINLDNGKEI